METSSPATRLQDQVRRVVASGAPQGLVALFLYGSSLTSRHRPDSDLDVAVLDAPDHPLAWGEQARLMDALERATGRGVDLRMLRNSSLGHQAHVLRQGRLVWESRPGESQGYARETLSSAARERERSQREWSQTLERWSARAS